MSARRRLATMGIAVGGVLAGHWLTYLVVAPIAGSRTTILHQTGHSYLGLANDLALVAALAAMASMFIAQLVHPVPAGRLLGITGRVVRFQVCAFVSLEVLERVTAGSPLSELIRSGHPADRRRRADLDRRPRGVRDPVAAPHGRSRRRRPGARRRFLTPRRVPSAAPPAGIRPHLPLPVRSRRPRSAFPRLIDHVRAHMRDHQTTGRSTICASALPSPPPPSWRSAC